MAGNYVDRRAEMKTQPSQIDQLKLEKRMIPAGQLFIGDKSTMSKPNNHKPMMKTNGKMQE